MNKCINCGAPATCWHHVVPKVLGGQDGTNKVPLCETCHGLIHGIEYTNGVISHSDLVKAGQAKARAAGKQIGRVQGEKVPSKKSFIAKNYIKEYSKDFNGTLNDIEVMKMTNVSRKTYYKYKKELKQEN